MHRELEKLLKTATGDSRFVVVVFLDIRGFSSFAKLAESSESALFLKSAYLTIVESFFKDASFFKPTGDGLLIILDYNETTLEEAVQKAVEMSIALVEAFPTICDNDPMVNFEVPAHLGIGLARGAATRLHTGDKVLDYSGRPLNLAARLMDIARPAGVVFSDDLGLSLLGQDLLNRFDAADVYVRGLAEDKPMSVHYLTEITVIADSYKRPLHRVHVHADTPIEVSVRELEEMGNFRFKLTKEPVDRANVTVCARFPDVTRSGKKAKSRQTVTEVPGVFGEDADGIFVRALMPALAERVKARGAKATWVGKVRVEYLVNDE